MELAPNPTIVERSTDGALRVSSLTIADGAGVQHKNVVELIRNNNADLREFGGFAFETRPFETAGGIQTREVAMLNEQQATLIMTYQRNTEQVRTFKKSLVKAFFEMAAVVPARELTEDEMVHRSMQILSRRAEEAVKALEAAQPLIARAKTYEVHAKSMARQPFAREVCRWAREQHGIDVKQSDVMAFLSRKLHLFIAGARADAGQATAESEKRGYAETAKGTHENGHNYATGKLTAKGQSWAWGRITDYIESNGTLELPKEVKNVA